MRPQSSPTFSANLLGFVSAALLVASIASLMGCQDEHVRVQEPQAVGLQAQPQLLAVQQPGATVIVPPASPVVAFGTRQLTMTDLRTLAGQQAWSELVDHLEDIPPASRTGEWQTLTQQACLGALNVAGQRGEGEGIYVSEALLQQEPMERQLGRHVGPCKLAI